MAREKTPSDGNEKTQRRVYVLPNELVDRIVAFQNELGLASEVEAARRLLDDALKRRDDFRTITTRLISQLKSVKSLREAARDILVDHPLIVGLSFDNDVLTFRMNNSMRIEVVRSGFATVRDENDNLYNFEIDFDDRPDWASPVDHPKPRPRIARPSKDGGGRMNDIIDEDIPF